jgi:hypothetical protein
MSDKSTKIPKKYLFVIIRQIPVSLGIEPSKLPSSQWLIAALRMLDPDHILVDLVDTIDELTYNLLNENIREADYIQGKQEVNTAIRNYIAAIKPIVDEEWLNAIRHNVSIEILALMRDYEFLKMTETTQRWLNLIQ